jgi:hypothetical protein
MSYTESTHFSTHEPGGRVRHPARRRVDGLTDQCPDDAILQCRAGIPDAPSGGGIIATLDLYVDGVYCQTLNLNSKQTWIYEGTNYNNSDDQNPADGDPRDFWDESHAFVTGAPIAQPANSISITSCGAFADNAPTNAANGACYPSARTRRRTCRHAAAATRHRPRFRHRHQAPGTRHQCRARRSQDGTRSAAGNGPITLARATSAFGSARSCSSPPGVRRSSRP